MLAGNHVLVNLLVASQICRKMSQAGTGYLRTISFHGKIYNILVLIVNLISKVVS